MGAGGWASRWAAGEGLQAAGSWAGWRGGYPGRLGAVPGSALLQPWAVQLGEGQASRRLFVTGSSLFTSPRGPRFS